MPVGGKRPGAGRKPGIPNKVNKAHREKALKNSVPPLSVLTEIMSWHYKRWIAEMRKPKKDDEAMVAKARQAQDAAEKVAPYLHSKMPTALQHTGKGGGPIQTFNVDLTKFSDEQLAALEPIFAALAAAGDDVGENPPGTSSEEA